MINKEKLMKSAVKIVQLELSVSRNRIKTKFEDYGYGFNKQNIIG